MDFKSLSGIKNSLGNMNPLEKLAAAVDLPFPALESMLADFASAFAQENRLFSLQIGDGKTYDDRLLPQTVEGEEALSCCYKYIVKGLSPDFFIPLDGLLGQGVQLDILISTGGLFEAGDEYITRCGLITEARALPSDGGFAQYQLTIEPPIALLRHRHTSRVFQDMTVPQIVQQILDEHIAANPAIAAILKTEFNLVQNYPTRTYSIQYREDDLAYIERLLSEEGIIYRFEHELGDVPTVKFIAFDDPWSLPQANQGTVRFHRAAATEAEDSLTEWIEARRIGPSSASLASYDYKPVRTLNANQGNRTSESTIQAEASLEDFDAQGLYYGKNNDDLYRYAALRQDVHERQKGGYRAQGNMRGLMAGQWFELQEHPAFEKLPAEEREFTACALEFTAQNNFPQSFANRLTSAVGVAAHGDPQTRNATVVIRDAEGGVPYNVRLSVRKRGLPLNPAFAHTKHAKPTAPGIQTAVVTGPKGETEVYTDEMGRIKIQFHWQRPQEHPDFGANLDERSSCWVRVAYPGAGAGWGHQNIPRIGQEVLVDFIERDVDRPIVTGVIHNVEQDNPRFSGLGYLPGNRTLTGIKTKEFNGNQYNELVFDDTANQIRARLSSEHGKSQLNQGFLVHPRRDGEGEPRGEGFELRTDRSGAVRAAEGVLLSAYARRDAQGNQLDREETIALLEMALAIAQDLGKTSNTHNAEETDTVEQERLLRDVKQWEDGSNTTKDAPVKSNKAILAATAPDGVALATDANVTIAANSNVDQIAAQDINHTVGRNFRVRVGEALSMFVQRMGMKLIAAAGKIQVQAQNDEIEIGAAKKMHLYSLEEILIEAPKVTIRGQDGVVVYSNGIVSRTTASHVQHAGNHSLTGPASAAAQVPGMPNSNTKTKEIFALVRPSGKPVESIKYQVENVQNKALEASGGTDASGATTLTNGNAIELVRMKVELPESSPAEVETPLQEEEEDEDEYEYRYTIEKEDGSPVDFAQSLLYRIDANGAKLHEGKLEEDGKTLTFPISEEGELTFWIDLHED